MESVSDEVGKEPLDLWIRLEPGPRRVLEFPSRWGQAAENLRVLRRDTEWVRVDEQCLSTIQDAGIASQSDSDALGNRLSSAVGGEFDVVIVGDWFLRGSDPEIFFRALRSITVSDASILLDMPNMSHLCVLERMIMGDITYDNGGLFDSRYRRFTSISSLYKALLDCGWLPDLKESDDLNPPNQEFAEQVLAAATSLGIPQATAQKTLFRSRATVVCEKLPIDAPVHSSIAISVIVPTNHKTQLELNLLRSPGLHEINAEFIICESATSAADAFSSGAVRAHGEWLLFCHQDVYFPAGTGFRLVTELEKIAPSRAKETLIGFAGLAIDDKGNISKSGLVIDRTAKFDYRESDRIISLDEMAVVTSRDSAYRLDPALGWHLWATDLCLSGILNDRPQYARTLRIPVFHNSFYDNHLPPAFHESAAILAEKYPKLPILWSVCKKIYQPGRPVARRINRLRYRNAAPYLVKPLL